MEILAKILALVPFVIAINAVLSGVKAGLDAVHDKLDPSGKISGVLASIIGVLQKAIDFASANGKH